MHVLEAVNTEVHERILVKLKDLESLKSSNNCHQIVVVRLKLPLVQDLESQSVEVWANIVDVLIEQLEVLVLREVEKHLLEAKLEEKISPSESSRIVLNNSGLG